MTPPITTRYGLMTITDDEQDLITQHLSRYGEWGWNETEFLASLLPEKARILDAGAFIGTFSLGIAQNSQASYICAIEANPISIALLRQNLERNLNIPFDIVDAIIGPSNSIVRPCINQAHNLGTTRFELEDNHSKNEKKDNPSDNKLFNTRSLTSIREEFGPFDLIKMDIEGLEQSVIEDDATFLSTGKSILWMECNEDPQSLKLGQAVLQWNLDVYFMAFPVHNQDNMNKDSTPIFPFAYEGGLLVVPKNKTVKLSEKLKKRGCKLYPIKVLDDLKQALWLTPRWGEKQWLHQDLPSLIAIIGHELHGEEYEHFLDSDNANVQKGRNYLEHLQIVLAENENLAINRLEIIEKQEKRIIQTEKALKHVEELAIERLDIIKKQEQQTINLEQALKHAEGLAVERLDVIEKQEQQLINLEQEIGRIKNLNIEQLNQNSLFEKKLFELNQRYADLIKQVGEKEELSESLKQELKLEKTQKEIFYRRLETMKHLILRLPPFSDPLTQDDHSDLAHCIERVHQMHLQIEGSGAWEDACKRSISICVARPLKYHLRDKPVLFNFFRKGKHIALRLIRLFRRE